MSRISVTTLLLLSAAMCIAQCISTNAMDEDIIVDCVPSEGMTKNCMPNNLTSKFKNVQPIQEFIYKCGGAVNDKFRVIPNRFQLLYGKEKLDVFYKSPFRFNFTLKKRTVNCEESFVISTSISNNLYKPGPNLTALTFSPDGHLIYIFGDNAVKHEIYYHKDRYCVQSITDDALTVRICKSTCFHLPDEKGSETCVPKCCPFGHMRNATGHCEEVRDEEWMPSVYVNRLASKPLPHWNGITKVVPPDFHCYNGSKEIAQFPNNNVRLLANGKLFVRSKFNRGSKLRWIEHASVGGQPFCIDVYRNISNISHFQRNEAQLIVTRCLQTATFEQEQRKLDDPRYETYKLQSHVAMPLIFMSCFLIYLCILIVYIILWEKQKSHGRIAMALSASQVLLYLVLMVQVGLAMFPDVLSSDSMHYVCSALGIIHNFAYISTYSWTVVLTFDVWDKLISKRNAWKTSKGARRHFFFYSCIGVGVPALVVTNACIMEWGFWEFPEHLVVMPGYSDYCAVTGSGPFLLYQGLPSALLLSGNLAFLVLCFLYLWEAKNVQILKGEGDAKPEQSSMDDLVALCAKLMVIMGSFLIFEFVINFDLIGQSVWLTFFQAYRFLHAAGLFYLFVCSKKVKSQLKETYSSMWTEPRVPGPLTATETVGGSATS